jgi:TamB, inner membrane protein subunit of TAM complex
MLKQRTKLIKKNIGRLLKWVLAVILGLCMSTFIVLQLPYIQNRLFEKLLQHLSHTTQFSITHQHFQLKWLNHVSLTGLTIRDSQNNTMLAVAQLAIRVNLFQLLIDQYVTLKKIRVQGAQLHLRKEGESGYNMHVLLQRLAGSTASATRKIVPIVIESVYLQDVTFSMHDQQTALLQGMFDPKHFIIHQISAELANLKAQDKTLVVDIRHLTGKHADGPIWINHFSTSLVVAPDSIQCKGLQLRTENSMLEGSCTFTYDYSLPAAALIDHVYMTAHLNSAVIAAQELAVFIPYFKQHQTCYGLSGVLDGKLNNLHIKDLQLRFGELGSHFQSCLSLQGLPHAQKVLFNIDLEQSVLYTQDLLPYLDTPIYQLLEKFNYVKAQGRFCGMLADFIAQAIFDTDLGKLTTDLVCQIEPTSKRATYKGAIATSNFELGTWLDSAAVQQLSMQGQIDGEGFNLATAHFQLKANIHKLVFKNYAYKNICAYGHFAQSFFQGELTIDDPHLKFQANAVIDLGQNVESIVINGILDRACLQALHLTDRCATLSTQLSIAMQGLFLDAIKLDAQLHQVCFGLDGEEIKLDALHIRGDRSGTEHLLEIDSALLAIKAEGDFFYASLASDLNRFIQDYRYRLMHMALPAQKGTLRPCTLAYQLHCKDINPLLRIFGVDAYVSPNTQLEGTFSQQEETTFALRLVEAESLAFKQNQWNNTQLNLSANQSQDGQAVSAVVQLASKEQQWNACCTTEDLAVALVWKDDQINFSGSVVPQESSERLNIQGTALLLDDTIEIVLRPTQIVHVDDQWQVHPTNRIIVGKSWTEFQDFTFYKGQQHISLVGFLSSNPAEVLHLTIKDCLLNNFTFLIKRPIAGVLNATAILQGTLSQPYINSDITLAKLTVDHILVGDLHAHTNWNHALQQCNMDCYIDYLQQQIVTLQGCYEPLKQANSLQLTGHLSHVPLAALELLVADHLSQLAGELSGTVYISGSPSSPQITGGASIADATVRVNYLNTLYQLSGACTFANQMINITRLHLSDDQQGQAVLQGNILHNGLKDFKIDATGSMVRFKLLSTTPEDNAYFYGTGILSGSLTASGPASNMAVCLTSKTDLGTSISIPMHGSKNTVAPYDFIQFVNFKAQYQDKKVQTQQVALRGLKFTLLLEITPDACAEIILNAKAGDVIKGRGQGNIKLEVDTEGALTMTGGFKFVEGVYNLALYPMSQKTFKIQPESKVTWYDSPAQGVLDVQAVHEQRATLTPLLEGFPTTNRTTKKHLVQVVVGLQGAFLAPEKSFTIHFPEYSDTLATIVNEFKQRATQDKQYAEAQALNLLLFQEFHSKTTEPGINTLNRYFSAFVSQQLSHLTSSLDDNLEIDVDVDTQEIGRRNFDNLNLNLAYNLVGGRLRISRTGNIVGNTGGALRIGHLIGDWTVVYGLTKDGRYRAKLYKKDTATSTDSNVTFAVGISLMYTRSFNQWRELWGGSKCAVNK